MTIPYDPLSVRCPVCKALAGAPCKRPRSRKGPHKERILLAEKEACECPH